MRSRWVLLAIVMGLACEDEAGSASAPAPGPVAIVRGVECEERMESAAPAIALRSFPDNPDVTWNVRGVTSNAEGRVVAEMEPEPDEVGYPRFKLLAECRGEGEPTLLATYAFENGGYVLLSTTGVVAEEFPRTHP